MRLETMPAAPARYGDRTEAGALLARMLDRYRGGQPLILGIPRGGIPVAAEVARRLEGELDVVVARKLGAPGHEELAIGAVTADGRRFLNEDILRALGVPDEYLRRVTEEQMREARSREQRFRGTAKPIPVEGRTVILVDDGLATGATMRAAARAVRARRPARPRPRERNLSRASLRSNMMVSSPPPQRRFISLAVPCACPGAGGHGSRGPGKRGLYARENSPAAGRSRRSTGRLRGRRQRTVGARECRRNVGL